MNRIILIGNGFDLAHNLPTSYTDFLNDYFETLANNLRENESYEDDIIRFYTPDPIDNRTYHSNTISRRIGSSRGFIKKYLTNQINLHIGTTTEIKNNLFEDVAAEKYLKNWVDRENLYYEKLKIIAGLENEGKRKELVIKLNKEFRVIQELLKDYLIKIESRNLNYSEEINSNIFAPIEIKDIALSSKYKYLRYAEDVLKNKQIKFALQSATSEMANTILNKQESIEKRLDNVAKLLKNKTELAKHITPEKTMFLNFNYTKVAEKLYTSENKDIDIINIHGELHNEGNPIIFGYGDEIDDNYKIIENLYDNDFLENIKSTRYHETANYRNLLEFIESNPYQIFIMGHSCGTSDRTLLHTLFEHDNCVSIKPYYHQKSDKSDKINNFSDIVRNVSRNFPDKFKMRERVVNKDYCSPIDKTTERKV